MSLITYRWPAAICGTKLGLWNGIILTVSSQQISHNVTLHDAMLNAASMPDQSMFKHPGGQSRPPTTLHALLLALRDRHSSQPIDKVWAIAFPFQKRRNSNFSVTLPIYDPSTPVSIAWGRLISSIASTKIDIDEWEGGPYEYEFGQPTTIQLLYLFPHPSRHHWFPSWTQVLQYPDVSIRDNDPIPVPRDMDCSLRILSGRIYRDCSLELKHFSIYEAASYNCSMGMGSKTAELVATVPGVELDIDPRSRYVLVDISPQEWPAMYLGGRQGYVFLPRWRRSVIIICQEVDNLAHAQPVRVTNNGSLAIMRYHLRRVTTLFWNTMLQEYKSWLPFEPSLEHIKSIADSPFGDVTSWFPPDTFCNRAPARDLMKNKCPVYEVYLV